MLTKHYMEWPFWATVDFNVNVNNPSHPLLPKLNRMLDCFSLTQAVSEPTHIIYTGHTSLIDLVLISNPRTLSNCTVIPPLASSDHNGIQFSLKWKPFSHRPTKQCKVWRYNQDNFELANSMLSSINWDDLLSGCNDTIMKHGRDGRRSSFRLWRNASLKQLFLPNVIYLG